MRFVPITATNAATALVAAHERSVLDFKRTYDFGEPSTVYELAKDVAAFANHLGGTILVGAVEGSEDRAGRAQALPGLTGALAAALVEKLRHACALCTPVPVADAEQFELSAAQQEGILGRRPAGPVTLVAINVHPLLTTPVGCRACARDGTPVPDAYRFPVRTVAGTRYLRPEELAFHMNSHERRMLLLLLQMVKLPAGETVKVWFNRHNGDRLTPKDCTLTDVIPELLTVKLHHTSAAIATDAEVPLTFVRAVWRSSAGWNLAIDGDAFELDSTKPQRRFGFHPPGALLV